MKPELIIDDNFIEDPGALFRQLLESVQWDRSMNARQTASFGTPYNYSQMTYPAAPMHAALRPVGDRLTQRFGVEFNNCLLNYYESGDNTMGFHSDDTSQLQPGSGVAIVSLGAARRITYRHKTDRELQHAFVLRAGSLLYMDADVQKDWLHAIEREAGVGPRISLTWRAFVLSSDPA